NVWQAAGVAIIGAVLLFSSTAIYKSEIAQSDIAPIVKNYVAETPVHGFMSTQVLLEKLTQAGADMIQAETALTIYKDVRIESAQYSFWALALFVLLHLPGFMGIPTQGWTQKP
ncbi:MFS transporter, partial [Escherichia coli]|nr:MFS transporter [Escherichia coli]